MENRVAFLLGEFWFYSDPMYLPQALALLETLEAAVGMNKIREAHVQYSLPNGQWVTHDEYESAQIIARRREVQDALDVWAYLDD